MGRNFNKNGNRFDTSFERTRYRVEIAVMFKIVRIPPKLHIFFDSLKHRFLYNHFDYFQILVVLMAFAWGRHTLSALYRHLDGRHQPHRSRFNNFLKVGRWDPKAALQQKAHELLAALCPKANEVIELILDDSKKAKRGQHMEAVGWIHDPTTGRTLRGHQYVCALLHFRGQVIPWGLRLYVKKELCPNLGQPFRKTTQLAADLIREFTAPKGVRVRVLFDSYYLCPAVVSACRDQGFHYVSSLKNNRNLFRGNHKLKTGTYSKTLFRKHKKISFQIAKPDGKATYTYVDAGWLQVSGIGQAHVVFSKKNHDRRILGLVTDDPSLSARQMIHTYNDRWRIEVYFKDGKQLLGLGQYQNLSLEAAVTHLHLVCFAQALLTHLAIQRHGAQGQRPSAARLSTAGLQNELRRMVWKDLTEHLKRFATGDQLIKELQRLLIAA